MEKTLIENKKKQLNLYQNIVFGILNKCQNGRLEIKDFDGTLHSFGEERDNYVNAKIDVESKDFYRRLVFHGDIGLGEAYVDELWNTDSITNVITYLVNNMDYIGGISGSKMKSKMIYNLFKFSNRFGHLMNSNTIKGGQQNIFAHYDLGNDFFKSFLDPNMMYSSGIFHSEHDTLEQSQYNKIDQLCRDLQILPDMNILEIGCGWGFVSCYLAQKFNTKVTGITISKEQYKESVDRVKRMGLEKQVTIKLLDYRKLPELQQKFDRIISFEMLEAVGHEYYPDFFTTCESVLAQDGLVGIQVITSPDSRYNSFKNGVDWIQKHIFPGSLLPSVGQINSVLNEHTNFQYFNLRDIGIHYARTLREWRTLFFVNNANNDDLSEQFKRKWDYYLCYCEAGFLSRNISNVQFILTRPNNRKIK